MTKYNENNERIKRKYLVFLKQAKGQNEASIDAVAKAISRFETYSQCRDFKQFHYEQAIGFKRHLVKQKHHRTGQALSMATLNSTVRHLKAFIEWLSREVGYKSRINYSDAEYFNLSDKNARIAKAKRSKKVPTLEQVKHVLDTMPNNTAIERRNRALIAFTLLTGARDSAIASFKLKHVDFNAGSVFQDARQVNTKNSKSFMTYFFPVGEEVLAIVEDWLKYLKVELLFGNDDPLFPKSLIGNGAGQSFEVVGLAKEHWTTANAIRGVFKQAFLGAGLDYYSPHVFRNLLAKLAQTSCQTPEQFKAWSQNLGHANVLTTFFSYGEVQVDRQGEIIESMKTPFAAEGTGSEVDLIAQAVVDKLNAENERKP